jgi:hypothetical protein
MRSTFVSVVSETCGLIEGIDEKAGNPAVSPVFTKQPNKIFKN